MKKTAQLTLLAIALSFTSYGQFRGEEPRRPSLSEKTVSGESGGLFFGLFDPDRFNMSHSISVGYQSFGESGIGFSKYTNSMMYRIADPLSVRADVSMLFTPFGSMANGLRNDISGIFLERAALDYRPSEDFRIRFQYRQIPVTGGGSWINGRFGGYFVGGWENEEHP